MNIFNPFKKSDCKLPEAGEFWKLKYLIKEDDCFEILFITDLNIFSPTKIITIKSPEGLKSEWVIEEFIKYFEFYKNKKDL